MKCFECNNEAEYFIVSQEENMPSLVKALSNAKPGQIIPMKHPQNLKAYCVNHWLQPGVGIVKGESKMSISWGKDGMTREELSDIYPDSEPAPAHIGRYDAVLYVGLSILGLCTLVALAWVALAWTL